MITFFLCLALVVLLILNRCSNGSFTQPQRLPENAIRLGGGIGGFVDVVGESNYQPAIKGAVSVGERYSEFTELWVCLEPEPTNPVDSNAVRVHFAGRTLGYLSRADAKSFRATHQNAVATGRPIFCRARAFGGSRNKPTIGVFLDFRLWEEVRLKQGMDGGEQPLPKRQRKGRPQSRRKWKDPQHPS